MLLASYYWSIRLLLGSVTTMDWYASVLLSSISSLFFKLLFWQRVSECSFISSYTMEVRVDGLLCIAADQDWLPSISVWVYMCLHSWPKSGKQYHLLQCTSTCFSLPRFKPCCFCAWCTILPAAGFRTSILISGQVLPLPFWCHAWIFLHRH